MDLNICRCQMSCRRTDVVLGMYLFCWWCFSVLNEPWKDDRFLNTWRRFDSFGQQVDWVQSVWLYLMLVCWGKSWSFRDVVFLVSFQFIVLSQNLHHRFWSTNVLPLHHVYEEVLTLTIMFAQTEDVLSFELWEQRHNNESTRSPQRSSLYKLFITLTVPLKKTIILIAIQSVPKLWRPVVDAVYKRREASTCYSKHWGTSLPS